MDEEDKEFKKFKYLSHEEKEDFILSVIALKVDAKQKSQDITYRQLSVLAESELRVRIPPSTLGNIVRKGGYGPYLLDRLGLDERFREKYDLQEIEVLKLIPVTPNPQLSHLYDAGEKGIPTERAREIIRKLEYDGLIEQSPDAYGYPYFKYKRTCLGKKLIRAISKGKYELNLNEDTHIQVTHIS